MMSRRKDGLWRPRYRDRNTGEVKESKFWHYTLTHRGKRERGSTGETSYKEAQKFRARRMLELGLNRPAPKDIERVGFADLVEQVRSHYKKNRLRSIKHVELAARHLERAFGSWRAMDITPAAISRYQADRLDGSAAPATVNWETGMLRQGFRLCKKLGMLAEVPDFESLRVRNTRTGFVTEHDLQELLGHMPDEHRGWVEFAYITGWRVSSEVLSREWRHVDFSQGTVRLEPHETKNDEARVFPLDTVPRLRAVLERQWENKRRIERGRKKVVTHVFTYDDGRQIKNPRRSWQHACQAAALNVIPHDFRRSAVRNIERAGISRSVAKLLVGHKSDAIYERYFIGDEVALQEAGQKLSALYAREPQRMPQVNPLTGAELEAERKVVPHGR